MPTHLVLLCVMMGALESALAADAAACWRKIAEVVDCAGQCDLNKLALDSEIEHHFFSGERLVLVSAHYYEPFEDRLSDAVPNGVTGNVLRFLFVAEAAGGYRYLGFVGGVEVTFDPHVGTIVSRWHNGGPEHTLVTFRFDGELREVDRRIITPEVDP
jgi:hypothetical protein